MAVGKPDICTSPTRIWFWSAFEPARLSKKASKLLISRAESIAFSMATLWEVAIKTSLVKPGFSVDVLRLHGALLAEGFSELDIRASHLARLASLPWIHRDPFDRLLVAQAMEEGLTLLTADAALKGYGRFVRVV